MDVCPVVLPSFRRGPETGNGSVPLKLAFRATDPAVNSVIRKKVRAESNEGMPPTDRPLPHQCETRGEIAYYWAGWCHGVVFLALAPSAPNLWLVLAMGLFGVSQVGHWVIERAEAAYCRKFMAARHAEV